MARTTGEATPDHRCTGTRDLRVEDVVRLGMLHVCFVRSPVARARITAIDVPAALQLDGVHAEFVAQDLNPGVRGQWYTRDGRDDPDTPRPPPAEDAAEQVVVEHDELPPVADYATALEFTHSVHASRPGDLVGERTGRPMEDLAPVFEAAPQVVGVTVRQQAYCPVPMGTRGIVAEWSAPAGETMNWAATQSPHEIRSFRARLLGVDERRARLVMRDTRGAFGQKVLSQREDRRVMLAAAEQPAALKCKPAHSGMAPSPRSRAP
ncbi:molybdopterin cofactor-binding domain-containing protein [Streptomyces sp. NPDC007896]|uniref:molybdopterin cofactor-binding domain-containing protein n=1 Tax=Streptomyces sp. NPDC007896 TaxID=3364784 RepID=UPI0036E505CA